MKPPRAYYPPLAAAFPVLAIFSANLALFAPHDIWRPLGLAVITGLALWGVGALIRRSFERGAWLALLGIIGVWAYTPVSGYGMVWGYAFVGLLVALAFIKVPPTLVLNRLALGLVLASGGMSIVRARAIHGRGEERSQTLSTKAGQPDILYVILDGYGRADQLQRTIGFDNTPFVDALRKRGFSVAKNSHSNYCQTLLSLSSALNLDYVPKLLPAKKATDEDREPLIGLINDSRVAHVARQHGYQIVAITTGFPSLSFEHADVVLDVPPTVTLFESTLMDRLPLPRTEKINLSQFVQRRTELRAGIENLRGLAVPALAPRLVIAHILAPHPPFVFDAKGAEVRPRAAFGFFDGSDFMTISGTPKDYQDGYRGQLQWLNGEMLRTIDTLLASKKPPIMIFQGDHGSKLHLAQNSLKDSDLDECFSNLQAVYAPAAIQSQFTDDWTPINTFRVLLPSLFGEKMELLPSRSFYSTYLHPYDFTDVTDQLTKPAQAPR